METPHSDSRLVKVSLVIFLALMLSYLLTCPYFFAHLSIILFQPLFWLLQFFWSPSNSANHIPLYAGFSPSGGKIDRFPLVFPLKGVGVWIVPHLPSPRPYFRAGYWVDDDENDEFLKYIGRSCYRFKFHPFIVLSKILKLKLKSVYVVFLINAE